MRFPFYQNYYHKYPLHGCHPATVNLTKQALSISRIVYLSDIIEYSFLKNITNITNFSMIAVQVSFGNDRENKHALQTRASGGAFDLCGKMPRMIRTGMPIIYMFYTKIPPDHICFFQY